MKLFMFYIGGDVKGANIELHDVRFAIGEEWQDCFFSLRRQWWGDPKSLHIDAWAEVTQADGHDVHLRTDVQKDAPGKLFFLNMGGYAPGQFEEAHQNILLVAPDLHTAQKRALSDTRKIFKSPHRDFAMEVEKAINLNDAISETGWHIHLVPAALHKPLDFTNQYKKIE